jgi:hypothetical protein
MGLPGNTLSTALESLTITVPLGSLILFSFVSAGRYSGHTLEAISI